MPAVAIYGWWLQIPSKFVQTLRKVANEILHTINSPGSQKRPVIIEPWGGNWHWREGGKNIGEKNIFFGELHFPSQPGSPSGEDGPFGAEKSHHPGLARVPTDQNKSRNLAAAGWKKPTDESRDLGGGFNFF